MGNLGAAETLSLLIMVLLGGVLDKLSAGNKVDDNVTSKYIIAFNAVLISMTVIYYYCTNNKKGAERSLFVIWNIFLIVRNI